MIRKSGYRFSEKIMLKQKIERDDDSKNRRPALVRRSFSIPSPALWNTGSSGGACHRAARSADPVADDDG